MFWGGRGCLAAAVGLVLAGCGDGGASPDSGTEPSADASLPVADVSITPIDAGFESTAYWVAVDADGNRYVLLSSRAPPLDAYALAKITESGQVLWVVPLDISPEQVHVDGSILLAVDGEALDPGDCSTWRTWLHDVSMVDGSVLDSRLVGGGAPSSAWVSHLDEQGLTLAGRAWTRDGTGQCLESAAWVSRADRTGTVLASWYLGDDPDASPVPASYQIRSVAHLSAGPVVAGGTRVLDFPEASRGFLVRLSWALDAGPIEAANAADSSFNGLVEHDGDLLTVYRQGGYFVPPRSEIQKLVEWSSPYPGYSSLQMARGAFPVAFGSRYETTDDLGWRSTAHVAALIRTDGELSPMLLQDATWPDFWLHDMFVTADGVMHAVGYEGANAILMTARGP